MVRQWSLQPSERTQKSTPKNPEVRNFGVGFQGSVLGKIKTLKGYNERMIDAAVHSPYPIEHVQIVDSYEDRYLEEALDFIQKNALRCEEIDWKDLRSKVYLAAKQGNIHDAIRLALFLLNDHHSALFSPQEEAGVLQELQPIEIKEIVEKSCLLDGNIGYLYVPRFPSGHPKDISRYASNLQKMIRELEEKGAEQWILDLRGNSGGFAMAMMMGLAPFFDPSEILQIWYGARNDWEGLPFDGKTLRYQEDTYVYSISLEENPHSLKNPSSKVALLLDGQTGSAGEQTALSFIGSENVRSFGEDTGGATTSHLGYVLPDGYTIHLAHFYMNDRQGNIYPSGIPPHEYTNDPLLAAKLWLQEQNQ